MGPAVCHLPHCINPITVPIQLLYPSNYYSVLIQLLYQYSYCINIVIVLIKLLYQLNYCVNLIPVSIQLLPTQIRTREAFSYFFRGMDQERLGRLLRTAYADCGPAECDAKVKKRLMLMERSWAPLPKDVLPGLELDIL